MAQVQQRVLDALETVLVPGRRLRLSPFVEAAQLSVLFGEVPDDDKRAASIRALLDRQVDKIQQFAAAIEDLRAGEGFSKTAYQRRGFIEAYAAWYFSINVGKVQLTLLDLARAGRLEGNLRVVDVGVGSGTTAVALLDFLLAWADVCALFDEPFPITGLSFVGIDATSECLAMAQSMVTAYCNALERRRKAGGADVRGSANPGRTGAAIERVAAWGAGIAWEQCDLDKVIPTFEQSPTLVMLGSIMNELSDQARANVESMMLRLAPGTQILVTEPGDRTSASRLMAWRRQITRPGNGLSVVGPCGQELGAPLPEVCDSCWNRRADNFHQTELHRRLWIALTARSGGPPDQRRTDEFENQLLSWSYAILERREPDAATSPPPFDPTSGVSLRYLGEYRPSPAHQDPSSQDARTAGNGREATTPLVKLCPAPAGVSELGLVHEPWFQLPALRYGQTFWIEGLSTGTPRNETLALTPIGGDETLVETTPAPDVAGGFTLRHRYSARTRTALDEIAYRLFGFERLHEVQHRVLERVLTGQSTLAIAATGIGKSECFILPAMLLPGLTIVVSPLKALMTDQYDQRISERYGLDRLCTYINGDVPFRERYERLRRMERGYYKLVYLTPEQLERSSVLDSIERAHAAVGLRYLALDEAHCISQWGHDFRPAYLNMYRRLTDRGLKPVRIALTATASAHVREDICEELELDARPVEQGGDLYVYASNRPELNLIVRVTAGAAAKAAAIEGDLRRLIDDNAAQPPDDKGAAIVFLPWAGDAGYAGGGEPLNPRALPFAAHVEHALQRTVAVYTGKMDNEAPSPMPQPQPAAASAPLGDLLNRTRRAEQRAFISGEREIMIATKGFGMGIDKANVRLVVHRTPPGTLEAYAQEAGRAGRDGEPADTVLYFTPSGGARERESDEGIEQWFQSLRYIRRDDIAKLHQFLSQRDRVGGAFIFRPADAFAFFCATGWPPPASTDFNGYLKRIIDTAAAIRPDVHGVKRCAYIEQAHQTAWDLRRLRIINADAIVASNYELGTRLRGAQVTAVQLVGMQRRDDALLWLANRLALSVHETVRLLSEMRDAGEDARTGEQQLLDFQVRTTEAWELEPGPAFHNQSTWDAYLDAFMVMHERRKANDAEAYRFMIQEYIGSGTADGGTGRRRACLRGLLLSYLNTGEMVAGDSCGACSVCVPDGNFDPVDARRKRVTRRTEAVSDYLNQLAAYQNARPPELLIRALLDHARSEEAAGRPAFLDLYGWRTRQIEDAPDYQAARWLDVYAVDAGVFELRPESYAANVQQLATLIADDEGAAALLSLIDAIDPRAGEYLAYHDAAGRLAQRLNQPEREAAAWREVLRRAGARAGADEMRRTAHDRLCRLHAPHAPLADVPAFAEHLVEISGASHDSDRLRHTVTPYVQDLTWEHLAGVLTYIGVDAPGVGSLAMALVRAWAGDDTADGRLRQIAAYLAGEGWELIEHAPLADALGLVRSLPAAIVEGYADLGGRVAELLLGQPSLTEADAAHGAALCAMAVAASAASAEPAWQRLIEAIALDVQSPRLAPQLVPPFHGRPDWMAKLLAAAWSNARISTESDLQAWLAAFPAGTYAGQPAIGLHVLRAGLALSGTASPAASNLHAQLRALGSALLSDPATAREAHTAWMSAFGGSPDDLAFWFGSILTTTPANEPAAIEVFDRLLRIGTPESLERALHAPVPASAATLTERVAADREVLRLAQQIKRKELPWPRVRPQPEELNAIRVAVGPERGIEAADVLVGVCRVLRATIGEQSDALVALEAEALCLAYRFSEARRLADLYPYVRVRPIAVPDRGLGRLRRLFGRTRDQGDLIVDHVQRRQGGSPGRHGGRIGADVVRILQIWLN